MIGLLHRAKLLETAPPRTIMSNFTSLEEAMIRRIQGVDKELVHDQFKY